MKALREVFLFPEGRGRKWSRRGGTRTALILKFRGIDTMSDAERLAGCEVRVPRAERMQLGAGRVSSNPI